MSEKLSLYERQKTAYEQVTDIKLPRRTHTLIRADGVGFSKFTKDLQFPYDKDFIRCMDTAAVALCEKAQGCKFGFVQSDEISIVLSDYDTYSTTPWYGAKQRKLNSVSAGIATSAFAKALMQEEGWFDLDNKDFPFFDARAWTIPDLEEVLNYFLSRQQDCTRNSLSSVAQALYSHKELEYKRQEELQEMIFRKGSELQQMMFQSGTITHEMSLKVNFNWNDIDIGMKRGRLIINQSYQVESVGTESGFAERNRWVVVPAPMFSSLETRQYLKSLFVLKEIYE